MSDKRLLPSLGVLLISLLALAAFEHWFTPSLGDVGVHLHRYFTEPLLNLGQLPVTVIFLLKTAVFCLILFFVAHFTMLLLQKRVLTHTPLEPGQQYALAKVTSYLIFALGFTIALQSLGLNLNSLVVVGGALGLGVGLGLQAIVSNFFAGLILLIEQPVKLGDRIEVGDILGDVIRLRGRCTWVRTNDNVVIIVPNSEFINQRVTNWTANDRNVRISLSVGVSYDSDPNVVREVMLDVARKHPDVLAEPAPDVIFHSFGDSTLDFNLRIWTTHQVQTPVRLKSDLYFALFESFRAHKIELPFPQRDLNIRSLPQVSPGLAPRETPG